GFAAEFLADLTNVLIVAPDAVALGAGDQRVAECRRVPASLDRQPVPARELIAELEVLSALVDALELHLQPEVIRVLRQAEGLGDADTLDLGDELDALTVPVAVRRRLPVARAGRVTCT